MKIQNIVMFIETEGRTEKNTLLAGETGKARILKLLEPPEARQSLWENAFSDISADGWVRACNWRMKACKNLEDLKAFLSGTYNPGSKFYFDSENSDPECLALLSSHGITHGKKASTPAWKYERKDRDFKQGETLHNLNGTDYLVLEVFSKENLLLMNMASYTFVVGVGVQFICRYPYNEPRREETMESGIEWAHGHYLSGSLSALDWAGLREKYKESPGPEMLHLKFIGMDSWERPVYVDGSQVLWKDVNPREDAAPDLCTSVGNKFDGEPDTNMKYMERYQEAELSFEPERVVW